MPLLTQAQYAQLRGVSQPYINKLIRQGKLHTEPNGKINAEKANAELESSTGAYKEPAPISKPTPKINKINQETHQKVEQNIPKQSNSDTQTTNDSGRKLSYYEARAMNEIIKAKINKVEYDKLVGTVLAREEVEKTFFDAGREIRDQLGAIPERIAPIIAAETDLYRCTQILKAEIHSVLESMSNAFSV